VADPPQEIEDRGAGQRWVFHRTDGDVLEADLYVSPGGFVREHAHPSQEEVFVGVSGTFLIDVAGVRRQVGPGDRLVIPPGTPHGFADAPAAAHLRVEVRPALRLADYFRAFLGLSRDGRLIMPAKGLPHPLLQAAVLMDRFAPEIAAPRIPLPLQRLAWKALAAVGRRRGLRGSFPEYGAP
jgi:quercetin dioxygenase-like cupin family protein